MPALPTYRSPFDASLAELQTVERLIHARTERMAAWAVMDWINHYHVAGLWTYDGREIVGGAPDALANAVHELPSHLFTRMIANNDQGDYFIALSDLEKYLDVNPPF